METSSDSSMRNIMHDFKNVLQLILLNTETIKRKISQIEDKNKIMPNVDHIIQLSVEAVNLSKDLLNQQDEIVEESFALYPLIHSFDQMIESIRAKDIEVTTEYHFKKDLWMRGGASVSRQLIFNLLTNSIDAVMQKPSNRKIKISVQEGYIGENPFAVMITVEDNGSGFSKDQLIKIEHGERFTTKVYGTGRGIGIIIDSVKELKGAMKVSSTEGEGTSFQMVFPAYLSLCCEQTEDRVSIHLS